MSSKSYRIQKGGVRKKSTTHVFYNSTDAQISLPNIMKGTNARPITVSEQTTVQKDIKNFKSRFGLEKFSKFVETSKDSFESNGSVEINSRPSIDSESRQFDHEDENNFRDGDYNFWDASSQQHEDAATTIYNPMEPIIHILSKEKSRRSNQIQRIALSKNWSNVVDVLAREIAGIGQTSVCCCFKRQPVEVRFISMDNWEKRLIQYCNCPYSTLPVLRAGFFPSSPVAPRTVFSIHALLILYQQGVRGSIAKTAWIGGLHAVLEEAKMHYIPNFYTVVSQIIFFSWVNNKFSSTFPS